MISRKPEKALQNPELKTLFRRCRSETAFSGTNPSRRARRVGCAGFTYESQKVQSTASVLRLCDRHGCTSQRLADGSNQIDRSDSWSDCYYHRLSREEEKKNERLSCSKVRCEGRA